MKRWLFPILATVVLALAAVSIVKTQPKDEKYPPSSTPPHSDYDRRVAAVGLVEASSENVSIGSHLPGIVERVHVTAGQWVKRGDPLIQLDTRYLEASLSVAKAEVAARHAAIQTANARRGTATAMLNEAKRLLKIADDTDARSISAEELTRRRSTVEIAEAALAASEAEVAVSAAELKTGEASLARIEVDLQRSVVTAPIEGQVLQVRIRAGEFAPAGPTAESWLTLGNTKPLHVRVDVDEHEAWRVMAESRAEAQVRGNAALTVPLEFVRFEPLVVPKRSLTGSAAERVDTRVLQVIYRVKREDLRLFVGQQMDVFIEALAK